MPDITLLSSLSLVTIAIVLAAAIFQFTRIRRSQAKRNEKPGGIAGPSA